mgnify:CR=1 FL=1
MDIRKISKHVFFIKAIVFKLYEKDFIFDDKITTGKVKIPIGIVFIVSKDMKQLQNY